MIIVQFQSCNVCNVHSVYRMLSGIAELVVELEGHDSRLDGRRGEIYSQCSCPTRFLCSLQ